MNNTPFAIYFCSPEVAEVSGEGAEAIQQFREAHDGKAPPWTPYDCSRVTGVMKNFSINIYVKVPRTDENAEIFSSYGVGENTLVLCTPDGELVSECSGPTCTPGKILAMIVMFKHKLERWKIKHPLPSDPEFESLKPDDSERD